LLNLIVIALNQVLYRTQGVSIIRMLNMDRAIHIAQFDMRPPVPKFAV
jgi:hypothetical protein